MKPHFYLLLLAATLTAGDVPAFAHSTSTQAEGRTHETVDDELTKPAHNWAPRKAGSRGIPVPDMSAHKLLAAPVQYAPMPVIRPLSMGRFPAPQFVRPGEQASLLEPALFILGFQAIGIGVLLKSDPHFTGFERARGRNLVRGLTSAPVWDGDGVLFNLVAHPLWGSQTYLVARRSHLSPLESFVVSSAASVAWEFLFEAWAEQPSIQDLLITSTVGSLLGELRFQASKHLRKKQTWWATALDIGVDPLDALLRQAILLPSRINAHLNATLVAQPASPGTAGPESLPALGRPGLQFTLAF